MDPLREQMSYLRYQRICTSIYMETQLARETVKRVTKQCESGFRFKTMLRRFKDSLLKAKKHKGSLNVSSPSHSLSTCLIRLI